MPSKKLTIRNILIRAIGYIVLLLSFTFLGYRLWDNKTELFAVNFNFSLVAALIAASIVYSLASLALILAWTRSLHLFGERKANFVLCFPIYARSQIAKYIPGNIVHVAGRHALGKAKGLSNAPLMAATFYEIIGSIACAGVIKTVADLVNVKSFELSLFFVLFAALLLLLLPFTILKLKMRFVPEQIISNQSYSQLVPGIAGVIVLQGMFFLVAGFSLLVLNWGLNISVSPMISVQLVSIFAVSWLAGFITPGSPAGIGVREAVMIAMLEGIIGQSNSLVVALLFRLVTVTGDIIIFALPILISCVRIPHGESTDF